MRLGAPAWGFSHAPTRTRTEAHECASTKTGATSPSLTRDARFARMSIFDRSSLVYVAYVKLRDARIEARSRADDLSNRAAEESEREARSAYCLFALSCMFETASALCSHAIDLEDDAMRRRKRRRVIELTASRYRGRFVCHVVRPNAPGRAPRTGRWGRMRISCAALERCACDVSNDRSRRPIG